MSSTRDRLAGLTPEKRRMLQRLATERGQSRASGGAQTSPADAPPAATGFVAAEGVDEHVDVAILGGGLAGLSLALQLRQTCPEASVLVAERRSHPVPEAAHKVGESTVEVAARYFRDVLGQKLHLEGEQLRKGGMRFYFPAGENRDLTARVELGAGCIPPVGAYQLDRGRFENHLGHAVVAAGAEFRQPCRVREVALGSQGHEHVLTLVQGERTTRVGARWVVDAAGRSGLLRRQLGLARPVSHHCHAAWFRLAEVLDPDEFAPGTAWRERVPAGLRRLGTNHLMGRGYWVWIIPLASGGTSVGVVVDADHHALEDLRSFAAVREWLRRHEPQMAARVAELAPSLQDFRVFADYAYGATKVYSVDRWCLAGDAGVFADPFYSPGSDFIAIGNGFITELVTRDLRGEAIAERVEAYDRVYLNSFESLLAVYAGLYQVMGNAQVMIAKVVWDFVLYWGFSGLLFFHDKLRDPELMARVGPELQRQNHLNVRMQQLFRDWDRAEPRRFRNTFIDFLSIQFLHRLHHDLAVSLPDDELIAKVRENAVLLDQVAAGFFAKALATRPDLPQGPGTDLLELALDSRGATLAGAARPAPAVAAELAKLWLDEVAEVDWAPPPVLAEAVS